MKKSEIFNNFIANPYVFTEEYVNENNLTYAGKKIQGLKDTKIEGAVREAIIVMVVDRRGDLNDVYATVNLERDCDCKLGDKNLLLSLMTGVFSNDSSTIINLGLMMNYLKSKGVPIIIEQHDSNALRQKIVDFTAGKTESICNLTAIEPLTLFTKAMIGEYHFRDELYAYELVETPECYEIKTSCGVTFKANKSVFEAFLLNTLEDVRDVVYMEKSHVYVTDREKESALTLRDSLLAFLAAYDLTIGQWIEARRVIFGGKSTKTVSEESKEVSTKKQIAAYMEDAIATVLIKDLCKIVKDNTSDTDVIKDLLKIVQRYKTSNTSEQRPVPRTITNHSDAGVQIIVKQL